MSQNALNFADACAETQRSTRPFLIRRWASRLAGLYAMGMFEMGWRNWSVAMRGAALWLDPTRLGSWLRQSVALTLVGRRADALECLERAETLLLQQARQAKGAKGEELARGWAQMGLGWARCSKHARARAAYLRAAQLAPGDADIWSRYARLLVQLDEPEAARAAHRLAFEASGRKLSEPLARAEADVGREASAAETHAPFAPADAVALEQQSAPLRGFSEVVEAPSARVGPGGEIVLDLTDLFLFLQHRRFVSGIQRVQAELALEMLDKDFPIKTYPAWFDARLGRWKLVDPRAVVQLIQGMRQRTLGGGRAISRRVKEVRQSKGGAFDALSEPVLFTPGATWANWRYLLAVRGAKRRNGLRFVPFVHDCIPLIMPETCSPDIPLSYGRWLAGTAVLADAFLVNSACTEEDLRAALPRATEREISIGRMPLNGGTELSAIPGAPRIARGLIEEMAARGFVVAVGSVEPRKNHQLLFETWRRLALEDSARAPVLVVVGRPGWREEGALNFLDDHPELQHLVALLPDVSDAELAWLYKRAMFSVCASVYEGWGMPVTESLHAGLPVVAARNSALTEAGGDAAIYFDGDDPEDLLRIVRALSFEEGALRAARRKINNAPLRSWRALAGDALRILGAVANRAPCPSRLAPQLEAGRSYAFSQRAFGRDLAVCEAALHGQAWVGREQGAMWAFGGSPARLAMRAPEGVERIEFSLDLRAPDRQTNLRLELHYGEASVKTYETTIDAGGRHRVELEFELKDAPHAFIEVLLEAEATPYERAIGVERMRLSNQKPKALAPPLKITS